MAKKKSNKVNKPRTTFADFGCLNPVTRVVPNKKAYSRKQKHKPTYE